MLIRALLASTHYEALGVARAKFLEFKGWKQNELKRKAGLF